MKSSSSFVVALANKVTSLPIATMVAPRSTLRPGQRKIGRQYSRCFAMRLNSQKCFLHLGLDLRRTRVAEIAHIGGKVRRTDENTIDAIDRGNLVKRGSPAVVSICRSRQFPSFAVWRCPECDLNGKRERVLRRRHEHHARITHRLSTIGISSVCAPMSGNCLTIYVSPMGGS